jgi:hypothetical protein
MTTPAELRTLIDHARETLQLATQAAGQLGEDSIRKTVRQAWATLQNPEFTATLNRADPPE